MLTSKEIGPFIIIVPLIALCICLVGVSYTARKCPLLASTIAIWYILVMVIAFLNPFHKVDSLEWSENKIDDILGIGLMIAGMMVPLIVLYLQFTKSHSVRSFVLLKEERLYHFQQYNLFRLSGMAFLYLYFTGENQNYAVLHGGICDTTIAITSIPLFQYIQKHGGLGKWRSVVMAWNFFGLVVDFGLTFILFLCNFLGYFQPQYPLAIFLQNPISTIILLNVPLAAAIHILVLTKFDTIVEKAGSSDEKLEIVD